MALVGLDGRWLQVNHALSDIVGYPEAELVGRSSLEITHPEDVEAERPLLEQLLADEVRSYRVQKRYLHAAGHEVWVVQHGSLVRDDGGTPLYRVTHIEDITQRKQSEMMLAHMAMHDSLTGLPNRTLALDRLGQSLARAKRRPTGVAALVLDLDRFKVINDSLGHGAGDQLLLATAQRLTQLLRPSDTVARIGGDEFVLICEDVADRSDAEHIAQRVLTAMVEPFLLGEHEVVVGISVGLALAKGDASAEDLIRDADAAMYRAKDAGRNRYEIFDESFRAGVVARLQTEQDLRRALERDEFRLHYQPLIDLESGFTVGVEALLRWQHPERGLIPPLDFIPLAEETGLIVPIGAWVVREACRQARTWREAEPNRQALRIAVNLSARQLAQPDLADLVAEALEETGTDPSSLVLEITESVLTEDAESTVEALRALKSLGVRISVDDFGTGYSSLLYLKRFPVDILKVDRSFVEGLGTDPEDSAIVAGVVGLARTLGLTTVAEGVETEKQLEALRDLGCEFGQGFLWARPQAPDQVSISEIRIPA
jgi:diguanylate cyclase (GGDEF)-like protein/PAS domain S-box-containing protein